MQPHDLVGVTPSGHGLLGIVERDETGVMCHECGRWLGGLAYHVSRAHDMTVAEYREVHQLPATVSLVSLGTSRIISGQSAGRVGSPGWERFAAARDESLPEAQRLAAAAAARASAGTRARRAKSAAAKFTGPRAGDEGRWDEQLAAYLEAAEGGTPPGQRDPDPVRAALGRWMSHQWRALARGRLSDRRRAALEAAGVPLEPGGHRAAAHRTDLAPEQVAELGDVSDVAGWVRRARRLMERDGVSVSALARASGLSPGTARRRLRRHPD